MEKETSHRRYRLPGNCGLSAPCRSASQTRCESKPKGSCMSVQPPPGKFSFNPPPNWPPPPPGWSPAQGWAPDPSWPLAPDGWQFWVEAPQAQQFSAWGSPQGGRVTLNVPPAKILYAGGWGKKTPTTG